MLKDYICNECKYAWSNDDEINFVRICPKCRSYNIQFMKITDDNIEEAELEKFTPSSKRRKCIINEYIVPWMIEI